MENLLRKISKNKRLSLALRVFSHMCVLYSVILFIILEYNAFCSSPTDAALLAASLGVPFILVTVLRKLINAPRPYEVYNFFDDPPKDKRGQSFPSRHVFSGFAISVSAIFTFPALAAVGITLSLGLCVARVLLGIHFIRDVAAGALVGIATAILGIILL